MNNSFLFILMVTTAIFGGFIVKTRNTNSHIKVGYWLSFLMTNATVFFALALIAIGLIYGIPLSTAIGVGVLVVYVICGRGPFFTPFN